MCVALAFVYWPSSPVDRFPAVFGSVLVDAGWLSLRDGAYRGTAKLYRYARDKVRVGGPRRARFGALAIRAVREGWGELAEGGLLIAPTVDAGALRMPDFPDRQWRHEIEDRLAVAEKAEALRV